MSLKQKAFSGVVWLLIRRFSTQGLRFVVSMVLARLLAPEDFGLFALTGVFLMISQIVIDQGFGSALIQREELEPEHIDTAFSINVLGGGICLLVAILIGPWMGRVFESPKLPGVLVGVMTAVFIGCFSRVYGIAFQRELNFKPMVWRDFTSMLIGTVVALVLALKGFGVWSLVWQQIICAIAGFLLMQINAPCRPRLRISPRHFKDIISFSLKVMLIRIIKMSSTGLV